MKKILLIVVLGLSGISLFGQANNYWNQNYGLLGTLLNGSVIAGSTDNSSVFYNPSSVTRITDKSRFSISGFSGSYLLINYKNITGDNSNVNRGKFEVIPKEISGTFRPFKNKNIISYFGVYRKNLYVINLSNQIKYSEIIEGSEPDVVHHENNFIYSDKLRETCVILGTSTSLKNHFSIGGGLVMGFLKRDYRFAWSKQIYFQEANTTNFYQQDLSFDYQMKLNTSLRLGLNWYSDKFSTGLVVNSPVVIKAIDKVTINQQLLFVVQDSLILLENELNQNLNANYKLPWSVAVGFEVPFKNTRLMFSTEYFHSIKDYKLFYKGKKNSTENPIELFNQSNKTLNASIGAHVSLKNEKIDLLAGFGTNLSNKKQYSTELNYLRTLIYNEYNVSFGSLFRIKSNLISLGINYGFSPFKSGSEFINLSSTESPYQLSNTPNSNLKIRKFTFIFGFEIFKK